MLAVSDPQRTFVSRRVPEANVEGPQISDQLAQDAGKNNYLVLP